MKIVKKKNAISYDERKKKIRKFMDNYQSRNMTYFVEMVKQFHVLRIAKDKHIDMFPNSFNRADGALERVIKIIPEFEKNQNSFRKYEKLSMFRAGKKLATKLDDDISLVISHIMRTHNLFTSLFIVYLKEPFYKEELTFLQLLKKTDISSHMYDELVQFNMVRNLIAHSSAEEDLYRQLDVLISIQINMREVELIFHKLIATMQLEADDSLSWFFEHPELQHFDFNLDFGPMNCLGTTIQRIQRDPKLSHILPEEFQKG